MSYGSPTWRDWVLDEKASLPFIKRALEAGINFFDTADVYSLGESEVVLGKALKKFDVPRDRVVVATKAFNPMNDDPNGRGLSRKHLMQAIDASLRRLGTDYVDLYQVHRFDPHTPIEETLEALHDIVRAGKALYLGASSMYAWQFSKMLATSERRGWSRFVSMQNHYNLVYREEEREMIPLCRDANIALIPWSPLARGFLVGNREPGGSGSTTRAQSDDFAGRLYFQPEDFAIVRQVSAIAAERGVNNAQVALAWVRMQPGITAPIIGATKTHHLEDALASLDVELTAPELKSLDELYRPHRVLGITLRAAVARAGRARVHHWERNDGCHVDAACDHAARTVRRDLGRRHVLRLRVRASQPAGDPGAAAARALVARRAGSLLSVDLAGRAYAARERSAHGRRALRRAVGLAVLAAWHVRAGDRHDAHFHARLLCAVPAPGARTRRGGPHARRGQCCADPPARGRQSRAWRVRGGARQRRALVLTAGVFSPAGGRPTGSST
jgi:aryl-alcohol dehydrogenase-like predicted oxidoreductase